MITTTFNLQEYLWAQNGSVIQRLAVIANYCRAKLATLPSVSLLKYLYLAMGTLTYFRIPDPLCRAQNNSGGKTKNQNGWSMVTKDQG